MMKDKLLIWEQHYDEVSFYEIIDKEELEAYIQVWISRYLDSQSKYIPTKYLFHEVNTETLHVNIKYAHDEYGNRGDGSKFPAGEYWGGFNYIELDKLKTWKK